MRFLWLSLVLAVVACGPIPETEPAPTPKTASQSYSAPEGPTGPTPPPADPCTSQALDLDIALEHCRSEAEPTEPPAPDSMRLAVEPVEVKSGATTELRFTMTNAANEPLALIFDTTCAFDVKLFDARGRAADVEGQSDMLSGGLCSARDRLAITLPPGGVLTKRIEWSASQRRYTCDEDKVCRGEPGSPIPPGTYRAEITSPFSDMVDGNPQHRRPRRASAAVRVTP